MEPFQHIVALAKDFMSNDFLQVALRYSLLTIRSDESFVDPLNYFRIPCKVPNVHPLCIPHRDTKEWNQSTILNTQSTLEISSLRILAHLLSRDSINGTK